MNMPKYDWDTGSGAPEDPTTHPGHFWEEVEPSEDHDPVRFYAESGISGLKRRLDRGDPIGDVLAKMFKDKRGAVLTGMISQRDVDHFFGEFRKAIEEKLKRAMPAERSGEKRRRAADDIVTTIRNGWEEYRRKYKIKLKD